MKKTSFFVLLLLIEYVHKEEHADGFNLRLYLCSYTIITITTATTYDFNAKKYFCFFFCFMYIFNLRKHLCFNNYIKCSVCNNEGLLPDEDEEESRLIFYLIINK